MSKNYSIPYAVYHNDYRHIANIGTTQFSLVYSEQLRTETDWQTAHSETQIQHLRGETETALTNPESLLL